jgi:hypothetical protein
MAYTINGGATDVGAADVVLYGDGNPSTILSSYASELAWVQGILGPEYTFAESDKYDVTASDFVVADGNPNLFALDLSGTPGYFFIKLGTGGTNISSDHWLYENLDELAWGVVNIGEWGSGRNINIGRISHVGEIGGGPAPVPEPATMLLLGSGLVGLAGLRRKFRKN